MTQLLKPFMRGLETISTIGFWIRLELSRILQSSYRRKLQRDKVLLIATTIPPVVTGGSYRPTAILKYGKELGYDVIGLSGELPEQVTPAGQYLLDALPPTTTILRAGVPKFEPFWRALPHLDGGLPFALEASRTALRRLDPSPPVNIIASGPSFNSFAAGLLLSKRWGSRLTLDFRDEWTIGTPGFVGVNRFDRWWEKRCLERASSVIFATNSFRDLYLNHYPQLDPTKMHVVPNGWDPDDFKYDTARGDPSAQKADRFNIAYVGRTSGHEPAGSFLGSMSAVLAEYPELRNSLQIIFAGKQYGISRKQIKEFTRQYPENILSLGELPKNSAIELMSTADALLVFNEPKLHRRLPAKIFEYIATDRPIILYGPGGELGRLLSELGCAEIVPLDDPPGLARAITRIRSRGGSGYNNLRRRDWASQHRRGETIQRMFEIACELEQPRVDVTP